MFVPHFHRFAQAVEGLQSKVHKDDAENFLDSILLPKVSYSSTPSAAVNVIQTVKQTRSRREQASQIFPIVQDSVGDGHNFRGLESSMVPRFKRTGSGFVAGLSDQLKIPKSHASSRRTLPTLQRHPTFYRRYTDQTVRHRLSSDNFRRVSMKLLHDVSSTNTASFIAIEHAVTTPKGHEREGGQDYRSIVGLDRDIESDDDDDPLAYESPSGETQTEAIIQRTMGFEKALIQSPNDVDLWIRFADFSAQQVCTDNGNVTSVAQRHAAAEIRISKLDSALLQVDNERLHLARLKALADTESPQMLLKAWRDTLHAHPDSIPLWKDYINYRSSVSVSFSKDNLLEVYRECFDVLGRKALQTSNLSLRADIESHLICLFLRCTSLLRRMGFNELALACFQAIIELNVFRPPDLHDEAKIYAGFEDFWDLELPRIGESGAVGWCNTSLDISACQKLPAPVQGRHSSNDFVSLPTAAERWLAAERAAEKEAVRPRRASEDSSKDDPFCVILFTDLRPFMLLVESSSARLELLNAFFVFMDAPFLPFDVPKSYLAADVINDARLVDHPDKIAKFWQDQTFPSRSPLVPFDTFGRVPMHPERQSGLNDPFSCPLKTLPATQNELFARKNTWFRLMEGKDYELMDIGLFRSILSLSSTESEGLKDVYSNFLSQMQSTSHRHTLAVVSISVEAAYASKYTTRLAKLLLNADPQNIALYEAYARYEESLDHYHKARLTYAQALSNLASQAEAASTWLSWAELEWHDGRHRVAIEILHASVSTNPQGDRLEQLAHSADTDLPAMEVMRGLRVRKAFEKILSETGMDVIRIARLSAFALFEYLTRGIQAACDVFEHDALQMRHTAPALLEMLWIAYSKILFYHSRSRAEYKPATLRSVLQRASEDFPANTIFLTLFAWNESRMRIQNRLRSLLEAQLIGPPGDTSHAWLFRIYAELHVQARAFSISTVRNLFQRAITSLRHTPSVAIWSLFIDFEMRCGELNRAKTLVTQAIQQCPWSKDLYLLPFAAPLQTIYSVRELRELVTLMQECGLRRHIEIDEYFSRDDVTESASTPITT